MHFAGAAGKVPVFGLLKRGGHVYTVMLADTRAATLLPIIRSKVVADSIVYTDGYAAYGANGSNPTHRETSRTAPKLIHTRKYTFYF